MSEVHVSDSPGQPTLSGLVVVDKEPGWTSHDVVARCRKIFGQRRVGHAGTLDPDATGLLLVGIGRATRLLRYLTALPKTYTTEIVLGTATATLDASGEVVGEWDMSGVTRDEAQEAARSLTGQVEQLPPMVSAVKVGGRRLHQLARQGLEVERPTRSVTVYRYDVAPGEEPGVLRAEVECSSGTYVRTLVADLGAALGGGAHVRNLRRTRVGRFGEVDAHRLDNLAGLGERAMLTPAQAVAHLDRVPVDADTAQRVRQGQPLDRAPFGLDDDEAGPWAVLDDDGQLLAIYEAAGTERFRPAVVVAGR